MELYIDVRSGVPIYDQIFSRMREAIESGALAEDAALPSIRGLAKDLRVSVITTKRAYEELEREGLIYTVAGKGSFVARRDEARWRSGELQKIEALLKEARMRASRLGLTAAELAEMMEKGDASQ